MGVRAVTHVGICVSDLARAHAFYRDVLGFHELSHLEVDDAASARLLEVDELDLRCVFLERDGLRIELLDFRGHELQGDGTPRPLYHRGLTHICVHVDDVDETAGKLEEAGATILRHTDITNRRWGSRVVFAVDPDGVRLELVQGSADPRAPLGEPF